MAIISRQKIVPYTPAQMYQLVNDIEHYPAFVPWCHSAKVHHRSEDEVEASLCFARGGLSKSFTTRNYLQHDKMIEVHLVSGPFKHLHGFWRFIPETNGHCKVAYDMEFEIAGRLLSLAFGPLFQQASNRLVDAFCQRAEQVYVT
jgi:ribosome-associated toxin RatA of RatAB toxin-antitoxin module